MKTSIWKTISWKSGVISIAASTILVLLWYFFSKRIDAEIILPSPGKVLTDIVRIAESKTFLQNLSATLRRGLLSFSISFSAGLVTGIGAGKSVTVDSTIKPIVTVIKTTPVMSVILLAIVWFKTGTVPVFAAFLITFPVMVENSIAGIKQTDKHLLEMAALYHVSRYDVLKNISIPAMIPYIIAGARTVLGLTWKVVVAGEILSLPDKGIGAQMQLSQLSLETGRVFAWTITAIGLGALSQIVMSILLYYAHKRRIIWTSG